MSRFDTILKHVSKTRIEKVNELSRKLNLKVGIENNNENQKLIKEEWICSLVIVIVEELELNIVETFFRKAKSKNKEVVRKVVDRWWIDVKRIKYLYTKE